MKIFVLNILFLMPINLYAKCTKALSIGLQPKFIEHSLDAMKADYYKTVKKDNNQIKNYIKNNCISCHSGRTAYINKKLYDMVDYIGPNGVSYKDGNLTNKDKSFLVFALSKFEERVGKKTYRNNLTKEQEIAVNNFYKNFAQFTSLGTKPMELSKVLGERIPIELKDIQKVGSNYLSTIQDEYEEKENIEKGNKKVIALGGLFKELFPDPNQRNSYKVEMLENIQQNELKLKLATKEEAEKFSILKQNEKEISNEYAKLYPEDESEGDELISDDLEDLDDLDDLDDGEEVISIHEFKKNWIKEHYKTNKIKTELTSNEKEEVKEVVNKLSEKILQGELNY